MKRRTFLQMSTASLAAMLYARGEETSTPPATPPFSLPPLPYGFGALEPSIDARTMEIHHDKHHQGYVDKLNAAWASSPSPLPHDLDTLVGRLTGIKDTALQTALRNNGGGHWNHSFFWQTMCPAAKSRSPSPELAAAIDKHFGSLDAFKTAFNEAAAKRFGSGWAWLIATADGTLKVVSTPNQDNPLMQGIVPDSDLGTPLLGIDVWEHAYYLHYQNRRADYLTAWWNVVSWDHASQRFAGK